MIGKRLINTGVAAADALVPSENFETVLYTGNGSTQRIGGYINRGAEFDGSSSTIILPNTEPFGASNTIKSISAWIKLNNTTSNTIDNAWIYSVSSNDTYDWFYIGYRPTLNAIQVYRRASATDEAITNATITPDTNWHHVVVQLASTEVEIYLDGTKLTTTNTNSGTGTNTSWINYANFSGTIVSQIGKSRVNIPKYFDGKIDQQRFFNRALTSSEVTTLYGETHASSTISTTDIFSDGSGVALYQLDGNANDTGGVSGKFGSAAIFNGTTSSYIDYAPLEDFFHQKQTFTLSLWFYTSSSHSSGGTLFTDYAIQSFNILAYIQNSNIIVESRYNSGGTTYTSSATYLNAWTHLCVTSDGTTRKVYVNGSLESTQTLSTNGWTSAYSDNRVQSGALWNDANNTQNNPYNGKIDDVRIYSDVLTSTEVGYIYNNTTASIPTDNLEAYYKLDGDARDEQQLYDGTATNVTYAYDGTATNVTYQEATKFQPDLVWIKYRNVADNHQLVDSVRGNTKYLISNSTNAESTSSLKLTSFDSNGFSLSSDTPVNANNGTYVAWCFKGGGSSNTFNIDGTGYSTTSAAGLSITGVNGCSPTFTGCSVNTQSGFGIYEIDPNFASDNHRADFTHGLNSTPELIITKVLDASGYNWHTFTNVIDGSTDRGKLNTTDAFIDDTLTGVDVATSTEIRIEEAFASSTSQLLFYAFHSVEGYSKIGSYTGTGAAGNTVETGFEPAFVMIKVTNDTASWGMFDNERGGNLMLRADTSSADADGNNSVSFTSNGFTLPETGLTTNTSGKNYIYLAIAADPDTTTPTVENSFDVVTYTGDGGTDRQINTDFKPDLVWVKQRNAADNHAIFDSVRGVNLSISSNLTNATNDRNTQTTKGVTSFNNEGFTLGSWDNVNANNDTYVAWCWKAGEHDDNLPQINTEGSIDSVVSVNAEAGFSIVKYSGTGSVGATVGHGLSSAPELYIIKEITAADDWMVVAKIGSSYQRGKLNTTDAFSTAMSGVTNSVDPTSTVITLGNSSSVNQSSQDYIGYFFHSVSGYQKIGSYSGTGSAGNAQNVGFAPRFVMVKSYSGATSNWAIFDTNRDGFKLNANDSSADYADTRVTLTSTGFQFTGGAYNTSGVDWIYLAIK